MSRFFRDRGSTIILYYNTILYYRCHENKRYLFKICCIAMYLVAREFVAGGSCWRLVTAEEIGGGFFNAFSFEGNVLLGRH